MKKIGAILTISLSAAVAAAGVFFYISLSKGPARSVNVSELTVGEKALADMDYENAVVAFEKVIAVEPNNAEAYLALAKTYSYMGDIDAAAETLENGYENTNSPVIDKERQELLSDASAGGSGGSDSSGDESTDGSGGGHTDSPVTIITIGGRPIRSDVRELILRDCGLTDDDLSGFDRFTRLERLDISGNEITDLSPLTGITTLKRLFAANNRITDASPLAGMQSLEYVGLRGNAITECDSLSALSSLKYLHLGDNKITSVSALSDSLRLLYLSGNSVSDKSAVKDAELLYCDII